jgi:phage terminase large subunit-like protein
LLVSVLYPAWVWCRGDEYIGPQSGPQVTIFAVSYSQSLAAELAVKNRRLCFGHWFQSMWSDRVQLLPDQASVESFANTRGGVRTSSSLSGGLIGRGGTLHLYDDLLTPAQANSDAERNSVMMAMAEGLPTRLNASATAARILVGQRVHEDDPSNYAVESWPDAVWLMFPLEYEVSRNCPQDTRTEEGELLTPDLWPRDAVERMKLGLQGRTKDEPGLSSFAVAALLQQSPVPRGGGIVAVDDWMTWPTEPPPISEVKRHPKTGELILELPEIATDDLGRALILVSVDCAYSEKSSADYNGIVVLGIFGRRREEVSRSSPYFAERWGGAGPDPSAAEDLVQAEEMARVVVMEAYQLRGPLNDHAIDPRTRKPRGLVQRLVETIKRRTALRVVIEDASRGRDTAQELRRELWDYDIPVELVRPATSKLNRLLAVEPLFKNRLVFAPGKLEIVTDPRTGQQRTEVRGELQWVNELIRQCNRGPLGRHDDLCDAMSQGLAVIRRDGWLELDKEFRNRRSSEMAWRPKPGSLGRDIARAYGVG